MAAREPPGLFRPAVLRRPVASDPGRPRVTVYDDTDTPTRGERVELSARVLANWVAKAANLLQDDLDVTPGSVVRLDLPPHWRTLYWALAVWSVGACVELPRRTGFAPGRDGAPGCRADGDAARPHADPSRSFDDRRSSSPTTWSGRRVETRPCGARDARSPGPRSAPVAVPVGVVDEARELATHGDVFDPWDEPGGRPGAATRAARRPTRELVPEATAPPAAGAHGDDRHGGVLRRAGRPRRRRLGRAGRGRARL